MSLARFLSPASTKPASARVFSAALVCFCSVLQVPINYISSRDCLRVYSRVLNVRPWPVGVFAAATEATRYSAAVPHSPFLSRPLPVHYETCRCHTSRVQPHATRYVPDSLRGVLVLVVAVLAHKRLRYLSLSLYNSTCNCVTVAAKVHVS